MRLCESPEFRDAIVIAKDYFNRPGLTEQFIEKDYYVTEALRIIAKLFSIHSHVTEYQLSGKPISTYARHYYDLFCLALRAIYL